MEALCLLIPLSLGIVALAAWIFFRMADSGQFDDPVGPAHQILLDDDRPQGAAATAPQASGSGASAPGAPGARGEHDTNGDIASAADQPSGSDTAASRITSCQPQNVKAASGPANSRV
ncbi:MAG: cbb3-type cytochrome oxidase assembly protein CcoS [Rubrivivax sp.]